MRKCMRCIDAGSLSSAAPSSTLSESEFCTSFARAAYLSVMSVEW